MSLANDGRLIIVLSCVLVTLSERGTIRHPWWLRHSTLSAAHITADRMAAQLICHSLSTQYWQRQRCYSPRFYSIRTRSPYRCTAVRPHQHPFSRPFNTKDQTGLAPNLPPSPIGQVPCIATGSHFTRQLCLLHTLPTYVPAWLYPTAKLANRTRSYKQFTDYFRALSELIYTSFISYLSRPRFLKIPSTGIRMISCSNLVQHHRLQIPSQPM